MLERLSLGPATVADLAGPLEMSAPAVSKHLRILEDADLVGRTIAGRNHHIHLNASQLQPASRWLQQRADHWEAAFGALDRLIMEEQ